MFWVLKFIKEDEEELEQASGAQSQSGPPLVEGLPHSGSHSVGFFMQDAKQGVDPLPIFKIYFTQNSNLIYIFTSNYIKLKHEQAQTHIELKKRKGKKISQSYLFPDSNTASEKTSVSCSGLSVILFIYILMGYKKNADMHQVSSPRHQVARSFNTQTGQRIAAS